MTTQLDVDGVPTLLGPTTGPTRAGLVFRVGTADETLARRGITHLVEHLALHSAGVTDLHYNGVTGAEYTSFHSEGTPEEVAGFLAEVCSSLRSLPIRRLATEKEILRTEENGRSSGAVDLLPLWRHGARDYGLGSYPEWGLHTLGQADLEEWVARYFTAQNAVLWVAGDAVPAGLRLDLPSGERRPAPAASSALPETPAFFSGGAGAVAWETTVRREPASAVFATVLERLMFRELRQDGGLSYNVLTRYDPRGHDTARIVAVADALPEKRQALLGGMVDVLAAVRYGRIGADEVATVVAKSAEAYVRAEEQGQRLPGQAIGLLLGRPVRDLDETLADLRAVTRDRVAEVAATAYDAGLLMTPRGTGARWAGYEPAPHNSETVVEGSVFRARFSNEHRLVVGAEGVSLTGPDTAATVHFDSCAAALIWPDGGRRLIGLDGMVVEVEPTMFTGLGGALGDLDARIPAAARVPLPARPDDQIPRPVRPASARWTRWTGRWRRLFAGLRLVSPWTRWRLLLLLGGTLFCLAAAVATVLAWDPAASIVENLLSPVVYLVLGAYLARQAGRQIRVLLGA
jgi:hypothetical protein